jgi:triphosphoribosyl-dephospho-CoA synthase
MSDPLRAIRVGIGCPADAVRWACVLEATSPKAGNVHPGKSFVDLRYRDFVIAAEIAAESLADTDARISTRVLKAVGRTVAETGTNVNLGILLLLGPLVGADESMGQPAEGIADWESWSPAVERFLTELNEDDGRQFFAAIGCSRAGALGVAPEMDVHSRTAAGVDLVKAMRLAAGDDRIARQYAGGFHDLLGSVVPVVAAEIRRSGGVLAGIAAAHLRLLAGEPDSLIARKRGREVAIAVQKRAADVRPQIDGEVSHFDSYLRDTSHSLNPGTTADLIAASLYLLLRTIPPHPETFHD